MARHLDPALVRLRDRRTQLGTPDVGVRLDPRRALGRPIGDKPLRGFRRGQHRHRAATLRARDVRRSDVDARSRRKSVIDLIFQIDLGVRRTTSRRPNRRHTGAQIQSRPGIRHLHGAATRGRIEEVIVHAHDPGNHRRSAQVHHPCAHGHLHGRRRSDRRDAAGANHDRLIGLGRAAGSVDDQHVREREQRGVDGDVFAHLRRE